MTLTVGLKSMNVLCYQHLEHGDIQCSDTMLGRIALELNLALAIGVESGTIQHNRMTLAITFL
jgi:hypothetical protein